MTSCVRGRRELLNLGIVNMDINVFVLLEQATLVAQLVLALLLVMSIVSWALIFQKWIGLNSAQRKALRGMAQFDQCRDLREAVQSLGADPSSPLFGVAQQGVTEYNRSREAGNMGDVVADNVRRSLHQGVNTELGRLGRSIALLATAANTAPFIGLFGTVWGIMHTFHAIGSMKSASLATVAPGISEALIATAMGLAVAIPATVGYNAFQGKIGTLETTLVNFAGMFLNRVQREINATRPTQRGAE